MGFTNMYILFLDYELHESELWASKLPLLASQLHNSTASFYAMRNTQRAPEVVQKSRFPIDRGSNAGKHLRFATWHTMSMPVLKTASDNVLSEYLRPLDLSERCTVQHQEK